jgi:CubicO group peptidase (beta-lactamase class C family)
MYVATRESPSSRQGFIRHGFRLILCAGLAVLLTACGGGGGGGGGSPPPSGGGNPPPPPPPPPPTNQAPTANAGTDQTVEMPFAAPLSGSGNDAETPTTLNFAWTGPTGVAFKSASSAVTEATFPAAGSYELTLTVSDGSASATDTVLVTVNAAVFPAADTDESVADRGWQRWTTPADAGMDAAVFAPAETYAKSGPTGPGNGVIIRRGRIVHSWGDIDIRHDLKSVTKSMGGIAFGLAYDQNLFELTDSAKARLPSLGNPPNTDPAATLEQITILNLATHASGFPKSGGYHALVGTPGAEWRYSDGGLNWLADVLTVLNNRDLAEVLDTQVWTTLGLNPGASLDGDDIHWRVPPDPATNPNIGRTARPENPALQYRELGSGITANVNAMARVGLLFLRRGVWNDTRVLSEEFIDLVRTPRSEIAGLEIIEENGLRFPRATTDYGVLWWTNATGQLPNVPTDAFWAWGLHENLIVVIPSLDLVIATNRPPQSGGTGTPGRTWGELGWDGDYAVLAPFLDPIVDSVN